MCGGSSNTASPNLELEAGFEGDKTMASQKDCSKLLELAAMDDLPGFLYEVEEKGCDINGLAIWYGRTFGSKKMGLEERSPILIASLYGSMEVLKYIIGTGKVDVNRACGSDGATALHCAAAGGSWPSVEVVKLLIDASADNNAVDVNGKRPGDLIAPCVKSSATSKKRMLEMLLDGVRVEASSREEVAIRISEKKEYPIDTSLPDINNGVYGSDEFRMYSFKVTPCSRAYSHDWTECPFAHPGENARRRDPRKYHYTCVPCPEFKKGSCPKGDSCEYAHGVFESWLHPAQYRTRLCKDEIGCSRKVCFFAHKPEELRPVYTSTGSGMPSPKHAGVNSLDSTMLSSLSFGTTSPMSPGGVSSSPMWPNKVSLSPPALQLPGSRLKASLSARNIDLDMALLGLDKIRTQPRQQLVDEMASLSSPYNRVADLRANNLDDIFGPLDPSLVSQLQGLSPKVNNGVAGSQLQSPSGLQIRQNMNTNQLRASYPANVPSSPSRKPSSYAFNSSVMNSRSAAFTRRSQSFIDRSGGSYRSIGSANSPSPMPSKKLAEWSSPDGKLDWGFTGEEANKLRKSASFGIRSGNAAAPSSPAMIPSNEDEPDVSWVNSLVKDAPTGGASGEAAAPPPHWLDQMYIEQEQIVA